MNQAILTGTIKGLKYDFIVEKKNDEDEVVGVSTRQNCKKVQSEKYTHRINGEKSIATFRLVMEHTTRDGIKKYPQIHVAAFDTKADDIMKNLKDLDNCVIYR